MDNKGRSQARTIGTLGKAEIGTIDYTLKTEDIFTTNQGRNE
jgi:hypothetical protein